MTARKQVRRSSPLFTCKSQWIGLHKERRKTKTSNTAMLNEGWRSQWVTGMGFSGSPCVDGRWITETFDDTWSCKNERHSFKRVAGLLWCLADSETRVLSVQFDNMNLAFWKEMFTNLYNILLSPLSRLLQSNEFCLRSCNQGWCSSEGICPKLLSNKVKFTLCLNCFNY